MNIKVAKKGKKKVNVKRKIPEIILNTMFEYDGYACKCVKDTENESPNSSPKITLKMYEVSATSLYFSYVGEEGLNMTGKAGGAIVKNVLGQLLALPTNDTDALIAFFEKYGFFIPLPADHFESAPIEDLLSIANRIKATVHLMNAIVKQNYNSILNNIVYLLYSPQIVIDFSDQSLTTCKHHFSDLLDNYCIFPDISQDIKAFSTGKYDVFDTFINKKNPVDIAFYNAIRSGENAVFPGSQDSRFKNLVAMYVGCNTENKETRMLIDFFYHFQTEVAVIKDVNCGSFVTYASTSYNEDKSDVETKKTLLKLAKIVIADEINHNIKDIHPIYDKTNLKATWEIGSLIQALYFSIFYMRAGSVIYKRCENPNCKRDKFFLVNATRTNKKYCCPECANSVAAQHFRDRKQKK